MKEAADIRSLKLALGVYALVLVLKLTVYLATGVIVLLAEALHTLSDIFISGFLLAAVLFARKAADESHMFGHSRAQNVAALVAATLFISFTSYELYTTAIPRLFSPAEAEYQNLPLALGVILVSMAIAAAPLISLFRQKRRGAAAKAQLMELFNDELGLLAALFGTVLIALGVPIADPIAAIIVATIIAVNAIGLFRENSSMLLGRAPGPEYMKRIESIARSVPGVLDVHDLRAEYIGPETVHADMHVEIRPGAPIEEAEQIAEEVMARVHENANGGFCSVHVDPLGHAKGSAA